MKNISVIYWSHGGNVEALADQIAKGAEAAGANVSVKYVSDAEVADVTEADAVAFGSPSMDNNSVEKTEMLPFINQFKLLPNNGKKVVLFGSFGWDDGKFMKDWRKIMDDYGFDVLDDLTVKESPNTNELEKAMKLGALLAK